MSSRQIRIGLQIFLAIVIVVLAFVLYESITAPYAEIEREQQLTEDTRERMSALRDVIIDYERSEGAFPDSIEVILGYIEENEELREEFSARFGDDFEIDSLLYSPRSGDLFEYAMQDTAEASTYRLDDPDTDDHIGTLTGDITQTNAASWE